MSSTVTDSSEPDPKSDSTSVLSRLARMMMTPRRHPPEVEAVLERLDKCVAQCNTQVQQVITKMKSRDTDE